MSNERIIIIKGNLNKRSEDLLDGVFKLIRSEEVTIFDWRTG